MLGMRMPSMLAPHSNPMLKSVKQPTLGLLVDLMSTAEALHQGYGWWGRCLLLAVPRAADCHYRSAAASRW
jgi:hypothetical protein